jgi:DNA-binding response OmpR family regulator
MSNARILVVDDDQVIQQLLKVNLELEGYAVEVASDGEEALVLFDRFHPDLVLLDIMMPKLDGWEVARRLAGPRAGRCRSCCCRPEPRNPTSRRATTSGSPPT